MKNKNLLICLGITTVVAIVVIIMLRNRKKEQSTPEQVKQPITPEEIPTTTTKIPLKDSDLILSEPLAKELKTALN